MIKFGQHLKYLHRNENTNQVYIFSELINTFRINYWITANLSSKFFLSGLDNFSEIGSSLYKSLSVKIRIIPEMNMAFNK